MVIIIIVIIIMIKNFPARFIKAMIQYKIYLEKKETLALYPI